MKEGHIRRVLKTLSAKYAEGNSDEATFPVDPTNCLTWNTNDCIAWLKNVLDYVPADFIGSFRYNNVDGRRLMSLSSLKDLQDLSIPDGPYIPKLLSALRSLKNQAASPYPPTTMRPSSSSNSQSNTEPSVEKSKESKALKITCENIEAEPNARQTVQATMSPPSIDLPRCTHNTILLLENIGKGGCGAVIRGIHLPTLTLVAVSSTSQVNYFILFSYNVSSTDPYFLLLLTCLLTYGRSSPSRSMTQ
jgi:hypothetical protein